MDQTPDAPYCLVTISDAAFSIATEVLLYSFLKYNPWFQGDLIVIADGLPAAHRARLARLGPVTFLPPDPHLKDKTRALSAKLPELQEVYRRFYSFEVFRLSDYRRVVYLDSDIYCAGDIAHLFTSAEPLLACPDGFTYGDRILARLAAAEGKKTVPTPRYGRPFETSFNAGVLSIGPEVLGEATYQGLLKMLDSDAWSALGPSKFTDQMALNLTFADRFAPLEGIYNYMIFLEEYQKCLENISFSDARLVHFAGSIKPWNLYDPEELLARAPQFMKFFDVWRELLNEARAAPPLEAMADGYRRQKAWIDAYNRDPLKPRGRLE